ncbi:MAG: glycosyltransferase family 4 protein [Patescibacteria group bacterium]
MKKVLIFSTAYFPLIGGAEVAIREVTNRITDFDFHLITAKIKPGLADTEKIGNVTVHRCGFGYPLDKYLLPFLGSWRALQIAKPEDVQAIWALMASYGGFTALVYTWLRPKTKMLLTLQEGDPLDYIEKRVGIFHSFFKRIFIRANAVQAISRFLADWSVRMGFKGAPKVIPNGVDVQAFATHSESSPGHFFGKEGDSEDFLIVTASRLVLKNATDDIIRALPSLAEKVKLVVVGDGEDREMLVKLANDLGVTERVLFMGTKTHAELPAILQACDVFCRPSLSEGLGNSFLEAMAAGLPIIGTPVGGIPDFLTDGETGLFCQPRDPASIAAAVSRIQSEPGLKKLVQQGGQLARTGYDWM